jgi:hypothetical protein
MASEQSLQGIYISRNYWKQLWTVDNIFHVSFLIKDRNVDSEESIVFGGYSARVDQARRSGMNSSVEFV